MSWTVGGVASGTMDKNGDFCCCCCRCVKCFQVVISAFIWWIVQHKESLLADVAHSSKVLIRLLLSENGFAVVLDAFTRENVKVQGKM